MIPNPWIIVAVLIALAGAYFKGHNDGSDAAEGQQAREDNIALVARAAALDVTAKAIAGIKVKNTTIKQATERVVHENIVYRDCKHTPDGLRLINAALTGRAEPADRGQLPGTDATK
jgi:hypothetical protein